METEKTIVLPNGCETSPCDGGVSTEFHFNDGSTVKGLGFFQEMETVDTVILYDGTEYSEPKPPTPRKRTLGQAAIGK